MLIEINTYQARKQPPPHPLLDELWPLRTPQDPVRERLSIANDCVCVRARVRESVRVCCCLAVDGARALLVTERPK